MESGGLVQGLFLVLGISILAGYVGHMLFRRYHVSDILILLGVGLVAGPMLNLADGTLLREAFVFLGPLGLAVVLFEGGLELAWDDFRRYAGRAVGLSLLTWTASALALALVAYLVMGFSPVIALLFGVATCATGILVVIPLLKALQAPAEARVYLTIETSLGDLLSAVATTAIAGILVLGSSPMEGVGVLGAKFLLGAAVGFLAGLLWARVLTALQGQGHGYALTLAVLLVAYAAAEALGGSGYLMALTFGLVVGNARPLMRLGGLSKLSNLAPEMRGHQSEIIFILRSVYFVYLGLVVSTDVFQPSFVMAGLALVAAIAVARAVAVNVALTGSGMPGRDPTRILLAGMMPRGLATALIAAIPAAMGVPGTEAFLTYTFLIIVGTDLATSLSVLAYGRFRGQRQAPPAQADPVPAAAEW
ncbi:MAG TPA: cation:proton antiporter [Candidatus Thermoplasmatota archaeon]|nr:cation:proton antiporter [Candidatus Thermoplasmatota archaeon]